MAIVIRETEAGFIVHVIVRWRSLIHLGHGLLIVLTGLITFLSTSTGQTVLAWFGW